MAEFTVRVQSNKNYKVVSERTVVAQNLSELADVAVGSLPGKDKYVLTYDATLQKFVLVPADDVIQTAAEDAALPPTFVTQLETDLDNQIDVDAGSF